MSKNSENEVGCRSGKVIELTQKNAKELWNGSWTGYLHSPVKPLCALAAGESAIFGVVP